MSPETIVNFYENGAAGEGEFSSAEDGQVVGNEEEDGLLIEDENSAENDSLGSLPERERLYLHEEDENDLPE